MVELGGKGAGGGGEACKRTREPLKKQRDCKVKGTCKECLERDTMCRYLYTNNASVPTKMGELPCLVLNVDTVSTAEA